MTAAKAGKKKRPPTPGTTAVKDRFVGFPLGREAQILAGFLRGRGAELVPNLGDDVVLIEWRNARQDATWGPMESVEILALGSTVAEAAHMRATMEARKRDEDVSEDEIKKRADDLAHQVYRQRRKPDVT